MILATIAIYLAIVIALGVAASRKSGVTTEEFFLAGRSLGPLVLFVALFGTNVTAFGILGFPGMACRNGVGMFGFFGAVTAFFTPLCFILLGYPIWRIGKRNGYITPAEMLSDRWQSTGIGRVVLVLLLFYTFLYLAVGLVGGGHALSRVADIDYHWCALVLTGGAVLYTTLGGMRGTAWTNVFQAALFLIVLGITGIAIANALGGPTAIYEKIASERADLLIKKPEGLTSPGVWAAGFLVGPMSVIAFPHIFMRLLAARDTRALQTSIRLYPWAMLLLFVPGTFIGLWGAAHLGLEGGDADYVLPELVNQLLSPWFSAVVLAAILAAVMSSLDAQLLTIAAMLLVDLPARTRTAARGRIRLLVIAVAAFGFALWHEGTIFSLAQYFFSGFTLLVPILVAAFFWPRSTAAGVLASCLAGHGLLLFYYGGELGLGVDMSGFKFGTLPVVWCLLFEVIVLVVVSLATSPPPREVVAKFANPFEPADD